MTRSTAVLCSLAALFLAAASPVAPAQEGSSAAKPKIDAKADQLLHKMSDFLAAQKKFTFDSNSGIEVVLKSGQKLEFDATSKVSVERPNRIRSDRQGKGGSDMSFYYDGKTVALYGRKTGFYATSPAPSTLDKTIDFTRDKLDLEAPAADLLYSNAYAALTEDVTSGMYVDTTTLDGVVVHHIALQGRTADCQLWIEDGDRPLPRKYVITTKDVAQSPEFTVLLKNWNLSPNLSADEFAFTPPADAKKIEFAQVANKLKAKNTG